MGVDTNIKLTPGTRARDVADVIGILLGCKKGIEPLGGNSTHCKVYGVELKPSTVAGCADIFIKTEEDIEHNFFYHYEYGNDGSGGISPRAHPLAIALGVRLVKFFGGTVDYQDCDEEDSDFTAPPPTWYNAEDGEPWNQLQDAMNNLVPITYDEVMRFKALAAYGND